MGYGYYVIDGIGRGYMVDDVCQHPNCVKTIDRGLSHLCYCCTWYFCEKHLTSAICKHDEPVPLDCFAGQQSTCCHACAAGEGKLWDCGCEPALLKALEEEPNEPV